MKYVIIHFGPPNSRVTITSKEFYNAFSVNTQMLTYTRGLAHLSYRNLKFQLKPST